MKKNSKKTTIRVKKKPVFLIRYQLQYTNNGGSSSYYTPPSDLWQQEVFFTEKEALSFYVSQLNCKPQMYVLTELPISLKLKTSIDQIKAGWKLPAEIEIIDVIAKKRKGT